jgi:hypothetical protein
MARLIKFYIPTNFKQQMLPLPDERRGKVLEFPSAPVLIWKAT